MTLAHEPESRRSRRAGQPCGRRDCSNRRHLRWATPEENHREKLVHGTLPLGERHCRRRPLWWHPASPRSFVHAPCSRMPVLDWSASRKAAPDVDSPFTVNRFLNQLTVRRALPINPETSITQALFPPCEELVRRASTTTARSSASTSTPPAHSTASYETPVTKCPPSDEHANQGTGRTPTRRASFTRLR